MPGKEEDFFWKDLLKIDLINGKEVPIFVPVGELLDEARKRNIDFENIKNTIGSPTEAPSYLEMVEKLGYSPDEGIAYLVWLLNSMGVVTRQSCEGHPGRGHGSSNPYLTLSEEMALKALVLMDGWSGRESGDVIYSRMIGDESSEKNLVQVDFMDRSLVKDLVKHIEEIILNDRV